MIGMKVSEMTGRVGAITASVRKIAKRAVTRMAAYQRQTEINLIQPAPHGQYSTPGTPPHTHPRQSKAGRTLPAFPQFIRFAAFGSDADPRAVVGPNAPSKGRRAKWAEKIGHTHEFGGASIVEKRVVYQDGRPTNLVLWGEDGRQTFPFRILRTRKLRDRKVMYHISYRAVYPKRPFAAPALRKTAAASRMGKFLK